LNIGAPMENRAKNKKDSFYEDAEHVFQTFYMYNMKILLGDFNKEVAREIRIYSKAF
jgi:hypothetical protein